MVDSSSDSPAVKRRISSPTLPENGEVELNEEDNEELESFNLGNSDELDSVRNDDEDGDEIEDVDTMNESIQDVENNISNQDSPPHLMKEPKKPLTSWIIFASKDRREKIMTENPSLMFGDVAKILGEQYRQLSVEEKLELEELVRIDQERYQGELSLYNSLKQSVASQEINKNMNDLILPLVS